ncbi:MAG: dihydroorotase family protein [Candidatus Cloacimonetes bacterium]|nr:dihydroorotase family protein [Candidatus Cloacimonadota bacterium]
MPSVELFPGICDFHVHVGEKIGGYELRDDFSALDKLARRQGLRAIGAFVTEEEGLSLPEKLRRMQDDARQHFEGFVHWHLTPVSASVEDIHPLLEEGCDLKFYTTYKQAGIYKSYKEIGRWIEDLSQLKTRILLHCEDDSVIAQASAAHYFKTAMNHTLRRPELAETIAVERVLDLAVRYDHPIHIVHVSTPGAALLIAEAKQHNPGITCETAPHYLLYNADLLKGPQGHRWLCTPPLRSEESRGLLVELLQEGVFDIIASDHCAFNPEDKDRFKTDPARVPCGLEGLQSLFPSLFERLVEPGSISLEALVRLCCQRPAELMGVANPPRYTLNQLLGREKHG